MTEVKIAAPSALVESKSTTAGSGSAASSAASTGSAAASAGSAGSAGAAAGSTGSAGAAYVVPGAFAFLTPQQIAWEVQRQKRMKARERWFIVRRVFEDKGILRTKVRLLSEEQIMRIKDEFQTFDKDGDGTITTKQVKPLFEKLGFVEVSDNDIIDMTNEVDCG